MTDMSFFKLLTKTNLNIDTSYVPRKTVDDVAKAPCETCHNLTKCRNNLLACQCYSVWVSSRIPKKTHSRIPNRDIYIRLFGRNVKQHVYIDVK